MKSILDKKYIVRVAICVLVIGLSFWAGRAYTMKQMKKVLRDGILAAQRQDGNRSQPLDPIGKNGMLVSGEIISKDEKSVTLKISNGTERVVFFSPATHIKKTLTGKQSDFTIGTILTVLGSNDSTGTFNATTIQIK